MNGPLLLTYNLDRNTDARLRVLCKRLNIRVRAVEKGEYALPIGTLAGIPVREAGESAPESAFSERMLVMCGFLNPQLNAFLQGFRTEGIPRVELKAILTPTNVTWNSVQLHDELSREHAEIQMRHQK